MPEEPLTPANESSQELRPPRLLVTPSRNTRGLWVAGGVLALLGLALLAAWWLQPSQPKEPPLSEEYPNLLKEFAKARPSRPFIVVDTAANRLYLRKGDTVLLEAPCSTGSGLKLVTDQKNWTFQTPRGSFKVISKTQDPVWRKPDWAFLEEGEPPPRNESERYEKGVLGEYALGIGDGYFIHGTLYTRLLGRNVTHGCIRLGEEELEYLARTVPMGTRVFIF
ncbi:MAG: hypothetical protein Kow001_12890 [Acidobacteriota bacterium]